MGVVEHFKTMCCLGLPPESAMIAIAPLLHEIVPHGWARWCLFGPGPGVSIVGFYAENPAAEVIFPQALRFLDDPTALCSVAFPSFHATGIGWSLHLQGRGYQDSGYYLEIEKPLDACWVLDAMIGDGGRTIASTQLTRPRSARPFSADDVEQVDRLRPWLAHALRRNSGDFSAAPETSFASGAPALSGQMILTSAAKLLFRSPGMEFLSRIMTGGAVASNLKGRWVGHWVGHCVTTEHGLPAPVRQLVRRLVDAATGRCGSPPSMKLSTPYGVLALEAKWLTSAGATHEAVARDPLGSLVAVTVELQEPAAVRAVRVLRRSGATPAQTKVGVRLALGKTKATIADELGIRPSSVADLTKKLYRLLDIHSAAELSARLWLEDDASADRALASRSL